MVCKSCQLVLPESEFNIIRMNGKTYCPPTCSHCAKIFFNLIEESTAAEEYTPPVAPTSSSDNDLAILNQIPFMD